MNRATHYMMVRIINNKTLKAVDIEVKNTNITTSTIGDCKHLSLAINSDEERLKKHLNDQDVYEVIVDLTDDPTNGVAGGVVSLGYQLVRLSLKSCKLTSFNPLVFKGVVKGFTSKIARQVRIKDYDSIIPGVGIKVKEMVVSDNHEELVDFVVPKDITSVWYFVRSIIDYSSNTFMTIVEGMDMRSSFNVKKSLVQELFPSAIDCMKFHVGKVKELSGDI